MVDGLAVFSNYRANRAAVPVVVSDGDGDDLSEAHYRGKILCLCSECLAPFWTIDPEQAHANSLLRVPIERHHV